MFEDFKEEELWIIPPGGIQGTKAKNLYENTPIILEQGFTIPQSLVIPHEMDLEDALEVIRYFFIGDKHVAIRSNADDEDGRTPGLYVSRKANPKDRADLRQKVMEVDESYNSPHAIDRRERLGIPSTGMHKTIQSFIPSPYSGSFSDLGEVGALTFTNSEYGLEAMTRPRMDKLWVDLEGKIVSNRTGIGTFTSNIAWELRELSNALSSRGGERWEEEFLYNPKERVIVQTTPTKGQPIINVKKTNDNIYDAIEVVGSGIFKTDTIVYNSLGKINEQINFDKKNKDYCLITNNSSISSLSPEDNILNYIHNASVVLILEDHSYQRLNPFSTHVESYIRGGERSVILGSLSPPYNQQFTKGYSSSQVPIMNIALEIQANEVKQKANVRILNP